jgi:tetratricopeptide (TPR) repeat protein
VAMGEKIYNLNIMDKESLYNEALNFYEKGDFKTAKLLFRKYISLYEQNVEILMFLAFCEIDEGNFDEALNCGSKISIYFRDFKIAHFILGTIAWNKGNIPEALKAYNFAISKGLPKSIIAEVTNNQLLL